MSHAGLSDPEQVLLAVIDVQERHFPVVSDADATLDRLLRFVGAARILGLPAVWTEHYPRAFGATLEPLTALLQGLEPIAKTSFGCFGEPSFARAVQESGRTELALVGTETHICIQQTALVALEQGLQVLLVADCLSARGPRDHEIALARMRQAGARVTTWEALVYEWMRGSGHPGFKQVLPLVKG